MGSHSAQAPSPEPSPERQPKYKLHAETASILELLKETFPQMPKPVQVFGWLVLLFLFSFLVLYEFTGVSYFSGQVAALTTHEDGQPYLDPVAGLTITHESFTGTESVVTNKEGKFVIPVSGVLVPLKNVEFWFQQPNVARESVLLPYVPLGGVFSSSPTKIHYVAKGQLSQGHWAAQHYFLKEEDAVKALRTTTGWNRSPLPSPGWLGTWVAYAATPSVPDSLPHFRLLSLAGLNLKKAAHAVYLDVQIDGNPADTKNIPNRDSPSSRRLTLLPDIATRFDDARIAIPPTAHTLRIGVFDNRPILRDAFLGSVDIALHPLTPADVGRNLVERQNGFQVNYDFLPPIELVSTGIPSHSDAQSQKKNFIVANFWLESAPGFMQSIGKVRYDLGPAFSVRYVETPDVTPWNNYGYAITFYSAQTITATVTLVGGSSFTLSTIVDVTKGDSRWPLDEAFRARNYYLDNQHELALSLTDQVIRTLPDLQWVAVQRAVILGQLKRYDEALAAFTRAAQMDDRVLSVLNSYAWFVADALPNPSTRDLETALRKSEQSLKPAPNPNYYDTQGWLYYKLKNYPAARKSLEAARDLQLKANPASSTWQEIQYHLGKTLLASDNRADALKCFQEVLAFSDRYPTRAKPEYVAEAKQIVGVK